MVEEGATTNYQVYQRNKTLTQSIAYFDDADGRFLVQPLQLPPLCDRNRSQSVSPVLETHFGPKPLVPMFRRFKE